jgi:cytoskeletal protein CcmA (bactofilin family)
MQPVEESTVIGKSVTIRGELAASEDLFLDGEFHGTLSLPTNRLTVELRQTAIVQGDIASGRLSIEEAASLKGRVEIVREGAPTQTPAPAAPETAESEPSLFSEQKI